MGYTGKVHNGVVVLDNGADLAEGTLVRIEPLQPGRPERSGAHPRLMELAGSVDDLPSDLARNHDHYLHGHPKQ